MALLAVVCPLSADPVDRLSAEMSLGYDTNPAQTRGGESLAFARYAVDVSRRFRQGGGALDLSLSGWYRDYEAANDSYRLSLRSDWDLSVQDGLGAIRLGAEVAAYRDALVPADARDEAALALRYSTLLGARGALGLSGEWRRLAYRNASLPWMGRPGSGSSAHGRGSGSASGRGLGGVATRRDDDLWGLGLDLSYAWSPDLSSRLTLSGARCDSEVLAEAYRRTGAALLLSWVPKQDWRLELGLGASRTRYDRAPRQTERTDDQFNAGLAVRRGVGKGEWFCSLDWLDSDSSFADAAFQQRVTSCGFAWSY